MNFLVNFCITLETNMKNTYKFKPVVRNHIMCVRWTPEETEWIKAYAARSGAGVNFSTFVRQSVFERLRQSGCIVPLEKFE